MKDKFWRHKVITILSTIALIFLNVWLLSKITFVFEPFIIVIKTVMVPVFLAGIFYYLFHPLIDWAERRNVGRNASILLLFVSITWGLAMALAFVIPTLIHQVKELISLIPSWWKEFVEFLENWNGPDWTNDIVNKVQVIVDDLPAYMAEYSTEMIMELSTQIFPIVGTITGLITVLIITPFVLFYLLRDGKKLPSYLLKFLPVRIRKEAKEILHEMNHQISQYIRGQILVSLCIGVLLYIGYLIIDLPYALTLAIIAALTSIIPYVGPTIAITPAIILALFTSPTMLIKLVVLWIVVQTLEGKFITPQILGKTIRVPPLTILFVILCSGKLFGVSGLILAIPGYAVLKVVVTHLFEWVKDRTTLYKGDPTLVKTKQMGS